MTVPLFFLNNAVDSLATEKATKPLWRAKLALPRHGKREEFIRAWPSRVFVSKTGRYVAALLGRDETVSIHIES